MRMLVIVLEDVAPDRLLKEESLSNLRQLMSAGCYGYLAQSTDAGSFQEDRVCGQVAQSGGRVVRADRRRDTLQEQVVHARSFVADGTWTYLRLALGPHPEGSPTGGVEAEILALDEAVGRVLELVDNETTVLLLAGLLADGRRAEPACSAFVLATPGYPALGELQGVAWVDLAPTLLDAAGYDLVPSLPGRSLVAGLKRSSDVQDLSAEEEALLRARLEGLGYIG